MTDSNAVRLVRRLGPFLGLALVLVLFTALEPDRFPTAVNFRTVLTQTVIVGLGAVGMTFVVVSGGIDLSVGSSIALSTIVIARLLRDGASPAAAALAGVVAGGAVGVVNGTLITRLRIAPFIVTLGTLQIVRGTAKYLAGEQKIDAPASWLAGLMAKSPDPSWLVVAPGVWALILLAAFLALVLRRSILGVHTYAIGSNEPTAVLCGIKVDRTKVLIYGLSGLMTGLAGLMQFSRLTVGDPTAATGLELNIIAAVVIGGASLSGGVGGIAGSLVGALVMAFLANGCTLVGVPNYAQEILVGAIIVAVVALDRSKRGA